MPRARSGARTLVIMAKEPVPGEVKTRMVPPLTHAEAASLYEALLLDTAGLVAGLEGVLGGAAHSPASAGTWFRGALPDGFLVLPQPNGDLGHRLATLFAALFDDGGGPVCLMNSDGPDLPANHLRDAFRLLEAGAEAVFGPNPDGGYYLVGLRRPVPELFERIPWSTPRVLGSSLARAQRLGLEVALLPSWPDIDTHEDLAAAWGRWEGAVNPPRRSLDFARLLASAGRIR